MNAPRRLRGLLLALAGAALLGGRASGRDAPETASPAWAWLAQTVRSADLVLAPDLAESERALAARVLPSVLTVAATAPDAQPTDADVRGAGFVVRSDGLVASTWRVLRIARREGKWLWARAHGGGWQRLLPLGATWWADAGLARIAGLRRRWPAVAWGDAGRDALGERCVAVGSPYGRPFVASAARLDAISSFDPAGAGGRHEWTRGRRTGPSPRATAVALRFGDGLSAAGGEGSPVFDAAGLCVGIVAGGERGRPRGEAVTVRPAAFVRRFLDAVAADAAFDPPDLGVRFEPPGEGREDLERAREEETGGAIVGRVLPEGPANHVLWEGDVVLEIEGHPVFAEVPESIALATTAAPVGVPADVVVWRGGRRQSLQVTARRARSLYEDFDAEHDARAGPGAVAGGW